MDSHEEREYLYWLCHVPLLGAVKIKKLYEFMGSYKRIYTEGKNLAEAGILKANEASALNGYKVKLAECQKELEKTEKEGIRFITSYDKEYPRRLLDIYGYPMAIFCKGKLPEEERPAAAVVGARNCSNYGRQMAAYMAGELARAGVEIISGLALGIDRAAHEGALKAGGDTYGILGCGIDVCYPRENCRLYERLVQQGGILTEFTPQEAPRPCNFPMRNRIISGISDVVLVMEAREKSGSLITAGLGLEQGKEIFALPGRVTDPLSAGCNRLIADGADSLLSPDAVLEYFQMQRGKMLRVHEKSGNGLAKKEKMVYSCLDLQPKNLEEIVNLSGLSVSDCMSALLELEMSGYILQTSHQYYGKKL